MTVCTDIWHYYYCFSEVHCGKVSLPFPAPSFGRGFVSGSIWMIRTETEVFINHLHNVIINYNVCFSRKKKKAKLLSLVQNLSPSAGRHGPVIDTACFSTVSFVVISMTSPDDPLERDLPINVVLLCYIIRRQLLQSLR